MEALRVALDTNSLYTTQAGVARHIRGLMRGFQRLSRPGFQFFELAWKSQNFGFRQPQRALKTVYREFYWMRWPARAILRREKPDLLHSTINCYIKPLAGMRHVLTIHDIAFLEFPERYRPFQRWRWTRLLQGAHQVDRVICISQFTADECMRLIGLDSKKIEVIYNGCDFHPEEGAPKEEAPPFDVPPEFFLFVGSLEPGKNLALLKKACQGAEAAGRRLPPLMIVGARWEGVPTEGPPPAGWHYLGRQPDSVLVYLYRRALALVFPSIYEGFGLPLAEAMALGCPVICSRVSSLPEVGGDAAYYTEMTPEAYAEAMLNLEKNDNLRADLRARGWERAQKFSWSKCADATVNTYWKAMKS